MLLCNAIDVLYVSALVISKGRASECLQCHRCMGLKARAVALLMKFVVLM